MNKTKTRVLSMVLTVLMLVSCLTVFAVADAAPFATAYECAVITDDGAPQISKAALLVDTTITEENGATVTRKWDGADYTFAVGTNAFKSTADAYAYAKANGIERPDIIITGWTDGADLIVEMESNVYGLNWNTAPMNEMTDSFNAIESNGADWTANETYAANEMKIGWLKVNGDVNNWAAVYGFTISKYINLGVERETGASAIDFLIKNCKMKGEETDSNILKGYNNKDVNCTDSVTFKNFWLDTIDGTSAGLSRFFGDNTRHLPYMIFDGLYVDFSKAEFLKANDHLKSYFANSAMVFKNSNLRRSGAGSSPYWNLCQRNDGVPITRELYYDNNVLYNTNQLGGFIYFTDGRYSKVEVTNNFVVATTANSTSAVPLFMSNGSDDGIVNENTYTITGNMLLGVNPSIDAKLKVPVAMTIEDNFTVSTVKDTVEEYLEMPGEPLTNAKGFSTGSSGSYIYNYDMNFSSVIKVTDVDFGPDSEIEIGTDSISIKCLGEATVVTPKFTSNPNTAAKGEVAFQLSSQSDFSDTLETVDVAKIVETKTATFYLRAYYKESTSIETVYQIKVIAATPVEFNGPFMENGFELAGKTFKFEDTAVFVNETKVEDDGNTYGYGFLGENYYKFKVDNKLVFDTMSMLKTQMTGVKSPNILLPSGEYGEYTFEYAANYYGTNAGINPVDKENSTSVIGDDWALNSEFGAYADTAFDVVKIADGLEGKITFNGITIRGQFNDTLRTMGKDGIAYGNLDIALENVVVAHIRSAEYADARDAGLIQKSVGDSTATTVFNLINKRSVNSNNTQVEFIENQYMDIEYPGYSDTYTDSFTVKNLYVKDMRNAKRLFNDFVPANVTIDNLYYDIASLGDTIDNTIGYFKTGAAVKSGSFTLINSNIRNGNTANAVVPVSIQGPRGDSEVNKLPAGSKYSVTINNNLLYNAIPSAAAGRTLIMLAPTMVSSLEIKDNLAVQTGNNAKRKAFIQNNTATAFKPYYSDADLAIIGNMTVDGNSLVGFDENDADFDIGLSDNNPEIKNTFVSDQGDAYETTGLTGIYSEAMGDEVFYLDFAKKVKNTDVLVTAINANESAIRNISIAGLNIAFRIYSGSVADATFASTAGNGVWSTNKTGTKTVDPATITSAAIGAGKIRTYYYTLTYKYNDVDYEYVYTVKVTAGVDCTEHNWETSGTFNNDATCQTNGTQVVECKNAGCFETKVVEKANSKSKCVFENYVSNNDATCISAGTETSKCKWCDAKDTRINAELYPISKTAHDWSEYVYNDDATCAKDGTETRVCEHGCGAYQTQTCAEHLKSTVAHTWGEYTYDGTATCKTNGTKSAMCTVEGCRVVNTIEDPNFPASDKYHAYGEYVYNEDATTAADGTQTATCSICGNKNTVTAEGTKLPVTIEDSSKIFKDVKAGKWYTDAINYCYSHGFIAGTAADTFGINTNVTRGMFITILARIAGVDTTTAGVNKIDTKFTDVKSGKWYVAAIKWASDNGIVKGTSDTTFGPDAAISRQDLCVMVVNYAKFMNFELTAKETEVTFTDATAIRSYAKDAVKVCQMADIVNGYTDGSFGPTKTATRAEAAVILYKLHTGFMN